MENKKEINVEKLWLGLGKFPECETCGKECKGRLDYNDLCNNVNYLKSYAEKNFEKNRETFAELKKIMGEQEPSFFSFGCGIGLDYFGAVEHFGDGVVYHPIENDKWAIVDTVNFKNFEPKLPKRFVKLEDSIWLLYLTTKNPVLCFFNSLFTISRNTENLKDKLVSALQNKNNFYFVCDYTIDKNYHMPIIEQDFIKELLKDLRGKFAFKKFDILDGRGIIITGNRK